MGKFSLFKSSELNENVLERNESINRESSRQERGHKRLISKDGNINFRRLNIEDRSRYLRDLFTSLLDFPWIWILFLFVFCFVTSWLFFAAIWYILMIIHGDFSNNLSNLTNIDHIPCVVGIQSFRGALLYSIETQQTIGYGTRSVTEKCPVGTLVLIIQSCFGLIIQALWVGLVYTKLSRPRQRRRTLIWSKYGVISLRDGFLTFQCRLGDMRYRSTLVEAHIRMYFVSQRRTKENEIIPLHLLDMDVGFNAGKDRLFFNWPIIIEHRIDSRSPLYQMDRQRIFNENFEILLVLEGIIEPTGMITQAKTSYTPAEILWGSRFETMIHFDQKHYILDYSKFHSVYNDHLTTNLSAQQLEQQRDQND